MTWKRQGFHILVTDYGRRCLSLNFENLKIESIRSIIDFDGVWLYMGTMGEDMLRAVLFDFGGVLAEEGFKEGLKAIAKKKGLDPENFYKICADLVYQTGYVTGRSDEHLYWNTVRKKTGVKGDDQEFRGEILKRFTLRREMIGVVKKIKSSELIVAILSDQTNWLDELDQRTPFHQHFDYVFNSFHLRKTKRDPSIFRDVCGLLGARPEEVLFVDDNLENVKRATAQGLRAIHFRGAREFQIEMHKFVEMR